jgi:hypothetical protein
MSLSKASRSGSATGLTACHQEVELVRAGAIAVGRVGSQQVPEKQENAAKPIWFGCRGLGSYKDRPGARPRVTFEQHSIRIERRRQRKWKLPQRRQDWG